MTCCKEGKEIRIAFLQIRIHFTRRLQSVREISRGNKSIPHTSPFYREVTIQNSSLNFSKTKTGTGFK